MARPLKDCVRIQSTSGTTGKRVVAFYTQHDIDLWEDCCARAIVAAGGTNEDVCQVSYGYGLFTGGPGLNGGSHKVGCLTLPTSSGNTERQIMFIRGPGRHHPVLHPLLRRLHLAETMKEMGLTPDQIPLKAGIFGAEAWSEEMRQDIQNKLGIKAYDIYGLTELSGPGVSFECSAQTGMHINEDHFIAEIIDPGDRGGAARGQQGPPPTISGQGGRAPCGEAPARGVRTRRVPCPPPRRGGDARPGAGVPCASARRGGLT